MTQGTRVELASVVEKVRKKILKIRSKGESIGEQNTKGILINPILSALGWDLESVGLGT